MFREPGEKNARIRVASSRESRQVPQCAYDVSIKTRERIPFVSRVFSVCLCRAARRRVSHADLPGAARFGVKRLSKSSHDALPDALADLGVVFAHLPKDPQDIRRGAQVELFRAFPPLKPGQTQRRSEFLFERYAGGGVSRGVRARARGNFLRASSRKCRRRPEESSRHANLGTTDGRARRKEISRGLNARGTHRGHVERFQDVEVLLRGVVLGFGVCGSRGCQPIVAVGIGWGNFLFDKHPDETHARVRTGSSDRFSLGLAFRDAATALCRLERVGDLRGGHGSRASSRKRDED